jgi:hypothetical protein
LRRPTSSETRNRRVRPTLLGTVIPGDSAFPGDTGSPGGAGESPGCTGHGICGGAGAAATCFRAATSSETRNRRVREVLSDGVTLTGVGDVCRVGADSRIGRVAVSRIGRVGAVGWWGGCGWDRGSGWGGAVTTRLWRPTSSDTRNRRNSLRSPRGPPGSGGARTPPASSSALVGIRCLAFSRFTTTAPGPGAPDPRRQPCRPAAAG